jgi:hypothetical protein
MQGYAQQAVNMVISTIQTAIQTYMQNIPGSVPEMYCACITVCDTGIYYFLVDQIWH